MVFEVNGVDMVPYVAFGGFKWQRNDVDGDSAGRDLTGELHRDRVATKIRLDITLKPLLLSEISTVLTAIMPEWVTVKYTDPQVGGVVTKTMYSNNNPASFCIRQPDGREYWNSATFPLIEK